MIRNGILLVIFSWLRNRRRQRILAAPVSPEWSTYIERNVRHWRFLDDAQRSKLLERTKVIVAEKDWVAGPDFAVTEEIKVTIAAQVAILLLGIEAAYYFDGVQTVIVYPGPFVRPAQPWLDSEDDGDGTPLYGESWHRGPIVLSWKQVLRAGRNASSGLNVTLHEFAHFLDGLDGTVEGTPPMPNAAAERRWHQVTHAEYLRLVGNARRDEATLLDHYGASSPAEFFAVATECFFERPRAMRQWHRDLYEVLSGFYHQDPAAWLEDAAVRAAKPARQRKAKPSEPSTGPATADDYFARGIAQLSDEQFEAALVEFDKAIELQPHDDEALTHRAVTRLHLEDFAGALDDCNRALAIVPNDFETLKTRGSVHLELGNHAAAVEDLSRVIQQESSDIDAWFLRGRALLKQNEPQQALADFDRALTLDQCDAEAYAYRGRAYELLGQVESAQADYTRAQQLEPELDLQFD